MPRLAEAVIRQADIEQPRYDRSTIRPGIVHIGLGAVARAHLAVYVDDLIAAGHVDLGIIGVSLHNDDTRRALEPQDWLYTLGVVDGTMTVVSLDNVTANGDTLRRVVSQLAHVSDPMLARWIEEHVGFPSSMVDRMVPATDDAFRATIESRTGLDDRWPVRAEPFSQWVLERGW
ncbi:MAG: hypothetical protein ABWZ99_11725, partial [Ilumatobacteraceae bacterium]